MKMKRKRELYEETRKKMSELMKSLWRSGKIKPHRPFPEEAKRKKSLASKRLWQNENYRDKIISAIKGKIPKNLSLLRSEEINKKRADALRRYYLLHPEAKKKKSEKMKGKRPKNLELLRTPEIYKKISEALKRYYILHPEARKRVSERVKGEKHPNWKGGKTKEYRASKEIQLWRKAILQRDNFTCQKCGQKGGKLVAHHIFNWVDFPELRFAIDNGITLCEGCHNLFHKKYGKRNNTRSQLEEFLNS
jgi:5-methylcytosine-specific restriction endonuclease McrA